MSQRVTLGRNTVLNLGWTAFGQFGSQTIHYLVLLVLAFLLEPSDFGLVGMALTFILFSEAISELGLAAAVVQQSVIDEQMLDSIFWANLLVSIVLGVATVIFAQPLAGFLGDYAVTSVLKMLSLAFPIGALGVVPRALLMKRLNFRQLSIQQLVSEVAYGAVGTVMAIQGFGVWSLAGATLAQRASGVVALILLARWRPKYRFHYESLRSILRFGFFAMTSSLLTRGVSNIDYFIIGRWMGAEWLGYYTLAFQLCVIPVQRLVGIIRKVAFPSLSRLQDAKERFVVAVLQTIELLALLLLPLTFLVFIASPWLIDLLYGVKWQAVVPLLQILSLAIVFYGIDIDEAVFFAMGKPDVRMLMIVLRLLLFLICCMLTIGRWGTYGVAASLSISMALSATISLQFILRYLNLSWGDFWRSFRIPWHASLIAILPYMIYVTIHYPAWSGWQLTSYLLLSTSLIYVVMTFPFYWTRYGGEQRLRSVLKKG